MRYKKKTFSTISIIQRFYKENSQKLWTKRPRKWFVSLYVFNKSSVNEYGGPLYRHPLWLIATKLLKWLLASKTGAPRAINKPPRQDKYD